MFVAFVYPVVILENKVLRATAKTHKSSCVQESYTLQKQQDMSNSALLTQIAQQTEIISFTECLPSMNEIFFRTVEGLDKHLSLIHILLAL